jgi:hypothetical protein
MADYSFDVDLGGKTDVFSDVSIQGLDDVNVDSTVTVKTDGPVESSMSLETPEPLRTRSEIVLPEPVVTSSDVRSRLDVEPIVSDSCIRLTIGDLPATRVCQPVEGRWAFTVFGVEVFAFESSGLAQTYVEPLDRGPVVITAGEGHRPTGVTHGRGDMPPPARGDPIRIRV